MFLYLVLVNTYIKSALANQLCCHLYLLIIRTRHISPQQYHLYSSIYFFYVYPTGLVLNIPFQEENKKNITGRYYREIQETPTVKS